jgi:hypothetical protein
MVFGRATHRRSAWLALFALWLQLALSFGHYHAEDFAGLGAPSTADVVHAAPLPSSPFNPLSEGVAHEACAICASMALADSLVLPDPVRVATRPLRGWRSLATPEAFVLAGTPHRLFQTRAPPVV